MITEKFINERNRKLAEKTIINLKKRHFEAYYAPTKEDVLKKAIDLIPQTDTISWGGSMSVVQSGLLNYLTENNYSVINRDLAENEEEKKELLLKALSCGTYLTGTNAISEDGQLVNIDCIGNRVAALIYGPRNVIVVSSINKIMPTLDDAIKRARTYAAPVNMQRIAENTDRQTPCIVTGSCGNCTSKDSICSNIVITRLCYPEGRIKVILTQENFGF